MYVCSEPFVTIRWRGSVYKLVWRDLVGFLLGYYAINAIFRSPLLNEEQKM